MAVQTVHLALDPEGFFARAQRRYGDIFTIRVVGEPWVVLGAPEAVKQVFAHGPRDLDSGEPNRAFAPVLGRRNLLLLDGEEHLHRRRMVGPSFHGERMRAYEETIRTAIGEEIARWPLGVAEPVLPRMQALTFSVILRCVLGVEQGEELHGLTRALRGMLGWVTDMRRVLVFYLLGPQRLERLPAFRREIEAVDRELYAEIARRRAAGDVHEREDILSLLISARDEHGEGLSDGELRDELVTLLIAGHETTATLIGWAVHELARHPGAQERLAAEGGAYADAVIVETLRRRPPLYMVARRLRVPLQIAGHELPAGTNLAPCELLVHRRADLYPDPWRWDPERFLERRPPPSEWFPFGGAVRRCVGAAFAQFEAGIVLEELTRALRLRPERQSAERVARRAIVLVPSRGARVIATRRAAAPRTPAGRVAETSSARDGEAVRDAEEVRDAEGVRDRDALVGGARG